MRLFLWDQMERFDLVPACQIPSRSTVSPIHMHTASKQPGTMQNTPKVGGGSRKSDREKEEREEREVEWMCLCMHVCAGGKKRKMERRR